MIEVQILCPSCDACARLRRRAVLLTLFLPHVLPRLVPSETMLLFLVRFLWWLSTIVACVEPRLGGSHAVRVLLLPAIVSASIVGFGCLPPRFRRGLPHPGQQLGIAVLGWLLHSQAVRRVVYPLTGPEMESLWFARLVRHPCQASRGSADGKIARLLGLARSARHWQTVAPEHVDRLGVS